jgi:hypothetical protein
LISEVLDKDGESGLDTVRKDTVLSILKAITDLHFRHAVKLLDAVVRMDKDEVCIAMSI